MSGHGQLEPDDTGDGLAPTDPAGSILPFHDLVAPTPLPSTPPVAARWAAFVGIVIGGLLGALIGYGVVDLLWRNETLAALGALLFGIGGAVGLGIVTSLTLRAMNEWYEVRHPEETP